MQRDNYDELIRDLTTQPDVTAGKMFGMPILKVRNKAFAGNHGGDMVFKLTGAHHAHALAIPGAHLFDPMGGRPMKEWVVVPADRAAEWPELAQAALEYCTPR